MLQGYSFDAFHLFQAYSNISIVESISPNNNLQASMLRFMYHIM